ncbi:MAG: Gfo/Idh/MocA family oxidoreductase [Candidatus Ratteibacteria bacterium]
MKNGKYQIGIIGTGSIAGIHIIGWNALKDVEIAAVADPNPQNLSRTMKELEIQQGFSDYNEMLKIEELDIIDICAPNIVHHSASIAALRAGKDVLCEKPLSISVENVEEMIAEANKAKKKIMAAQQQRFIPESILLKKMVDEGALGEIYFAECHALRRRGVPGRSTFISKALSGGGPMFDIGVHILDFTLWMMGAPKARTVSGVAYTKLAKREDIAGIWKREEYDVEDFAAGFVAFQDGRALNLSTSFLANQKEKEDFSAKLFGTEAGIHWPEMTLFRDEHKVQQDVTLHLNLKGAEQPHCREIREFFEAVQNNAPVPVDPEESLEVIRILEAIYTSSESKKAVEF